ncbi:transposase [Vibrio astriarenae]
MTTARNRQICLEATRYYHIVSRCVRRSFLCGIDELTQQSYEHRRAWIEKRLLYLAQYYCIDICAYAVMSNHYHIVVHVNTDKTQKLTDQTVITRWGKLHHLPPLAHKYLTGNLSSKAEHEALQRYITSWRERLQSISWFMRELNLHIANMANKEDDCTGHFWEGRYKCQALLDDKALIAAMAYTDLNPVRAGVSHAPEHSNYTSIKARVRGSKRLYPFKQQHQNANKGELPISLLEYIEIIDWTSRVSFQGKNSLPTHSPHILQRLSFSDSDWLHACTNIENCRAAIIGSKQSFGAVMKLMHRKREHGLKI